MKVAVFASGEGFGHVARCQALCLELEKRGHEYTIYTYAGALEKAKEENFNCKEVPREAEFCEDTGDLSFFNSCVKSASLPLNLVKSARASAKILKDADCGVIDNYWGATWGAKASEKPCISHFNCPHPYGAFWELHGIQRLFYYGRKFQVWTFNKTTRPVVVDMPPPYTITKYNVENFLDRPFYSGCLTKHWPGALPSVSEIKDELGIERKMILVSRGKSADVLDVNKMLSNIFEELDSEFVVITNKKPGTLPGIKTVSYKEENYYKYLKASEFVLSHGGHSTIMETLAFGKALGLIVEDEYGERRRNGMGLQDNKVGDYILTSELSEEKLKELILNVGGMQKNAEKFEVLCKKYKGAEREADLLERMTREWK